MQSKSKRDSPITRHHLALFLAGGLVVLAASGQQSSLSTEAFQQTFVNPPTDARPMMRWWWFGPAVAKSELARELSAMRQGGIGGVEIQPVYPLSIDDPVRSIKNEPFLSSEFLASVRFANSTARSLGLRVDITLGSGWPYGGPGTTLGLSAGCLKLVALAATPLAITLPPPAEGDTLIAAFAAPGTPQHWQASGAIQIFFGTNPTILSLPAANGLSTVLLFYASHTRQQVKRPAVGAEGFVLDHFSRPAIDEHLHNVADELAGAFAASRRTPSFRTLLRVYGSDWTLNLPAEFLRRRGYDLIPYLPKLYAGGSPQADSLRNDWGHTLADLIRENYLQPIASWSRDHQTLFRSQTYGEPAVSLADEATPDLPEGEGPQWRQFSFTRWASSASHLYGRPIVSAETFTWLHSPVFTATPLDMKMEADRMFLSGVNQIIGHGWPYTPPGVPYPSWHLYAAAVLDDHNPWFPVMPDVSRYIQRASWLLRQGAPVTDVAILLPENDAQAAFRPGHVSITDEMHSLIAPDLIQTVLDAGYTFDFVDPASLSKLGTISYPVVVVPPTRRLPLETARLLAGYVADGGHLIATGLLPSLAPGLEHRVDSPQVNALMQRLFLSGNASAVQASSLSAIAEALHQALLPDLVSSSLPDPADSGSDLNSGFGFIHRKLPAMNGEPAKDVYFVVNSSRNPLSTTLTFRASHTLVTSFSLDTGLPLSMTTHTGPIPIALAPYESAVFLLTSPSADCLSEKPVAEIFSKYVLNTSPSTPELHWTLAFPNATPKSMSSFKPWNTLPGRSYFSGEAIYATSLDLAKPPAQRLLLEFGHPVPIVDARMSRSPGIHALINQPIRDAAIVFVNGKRAGSLWHPPYSLDIAPLLRGGVNRIEVHVFNTAVNSLAGQPPRDYAALTAKYGKRFDPQDMDQIRPLPSGLLSAPTLRTQSAQSF